VGAALDRVDPPRLDLWRMAQTLSGREVALVGLARLPIDASDRILLDEPTNHLDLASMEAVEPALAAYDGAPIVFSHDEHVLAGVGITSQPRLGGED
jgi:ATPase subunit of ABC transporter with duplicated ATPase domains